MGMSGMDAGGGGMGGERDRGFSAAQRLLDRNFEQDESELENPLGWGVDFVKFF